MPPSLLRDALFVGAVVAVVVFCGVLLVLSLAGPGPVWEPCR